MYIHAMKMLYKLKKLKKQPDYMYENTQLNMKYYENKVNTFIKITSIIIKKHNMIKNRLPY